MTAIGDEMGQYDRTEPEMLKEYMTLACGLPYDLEARVDMEGDVGYTYGTEGFITDALIYEDSWTTVAVEAKQFVTNGERLIKGCLSDGLGQAIRYNYHFEKAELWHFYVVPYYKDSPEQDAALLQVGKCHDRVTEWIDELDLPITLRSIAIRHTRGEVQPLATLGTSVIDSDP